MRTRGGTHYYKWEHIDSVKIRRFAEKGPASSLAGRIIDGPAKQPIVEVKLRRSLRVPLWRGYGTAILGIPTLVFKTAAFCLEDPQGFVQAAEALMRGRITPSTGNDTEEIT